MFATITVARGRLLTVPAALLLIMAVTPHALSTQFNRPKEVPNPDAPKAGELPSWCHPDTPGFTLNFNPDGTLGWVDTTGENPIQFIVGKDLADGTFTGPDQGCVETKRNANTIRECRKFGENYVYVDVTYLEYTCQGAKRRIFTSFKMVKDIQGQPISCEHYQYVEDARKAQDFGEDWPGANLPAAAPSSPQGLVSPILTTTDDPNETTVIWIDQAGNQAVAKYRSDGTSQWDWTGKPPPKPTSLSGWRVPGAAESVSTGDDGSNAYRYADGTTMVVSPPDAGAGSDDPKTVTVTKSDKSKQVFERQPTGKYARTEFDPDGNPVPERKTAAEVDENQSSGTGTPSSAGASYCPCRSQSCGFGVVTATDSATWCRFGRARVVATVLTPIGADLIASVAPANSAMVAPAAPRVTDRSSSTPGAPQAVGERPKEAAPPMAPPPRRGRPAATTPQTNYPPRTSAPSPSPPGQPQTANQTPPPIKSPSPPTADTLPTPDQVTIDFNEKVNVKELAENRQVATAEPSAALKLKSVTPDLPGRSDKSAQDKGFDKDPATGRMDPDGHVRIATDDPQAYGLASGPGAPTHYRAEIDAPEHSGFVAETTGKPAVKSAELASALPAGVKAAIDTFKVGGHIYARVGLDWSRSQQLDPAVPASSIGRAIDARLESDTCRRTKPAPALGLGPATPRAIANALPATIIKLRRTVEVGRAR